MKNFIFIFVMALIALAVDAKPRKPKTVEPLPVIVQSKPNLTNLSEGHYIKQVKATVVKN